MKYRAASDPHCTSAVQVVATQDASRCWCCITVVLPRGRGTRSLEVPDSSQYVAGCRIHGAEGPSRAPRVRRQRRTRGPAGYLVPALLVGKIESMGQIAHRWVTVRQQRSIAMDDSRKNR